MLIIGCDFHTRYQQIAMLDDQTGELTERRLGHSIEGKTMLIHTGSMLWLIFLMWVPQV